VRSITVIGAEPQIELPSLNQRVRPLFGVTERGVRPTDAERKGTQNRQTTCGKLLTHSAGATFGVLRVVRPESGPV
jgi:hypothetical protein